ncbi:hypothetical protein [Actinocrispum wychmicini]|uniref:Uncharacterized protein n=1 Tax=Actinocrispum wychmicini TaxID=1213861 RepID=A0A4R2K5L7_9PSEU|nr:hypothetical protein [Actinocrispum wychmicini]TCO65156.1 hypothetical protein EV192_101944 [Actinocrispum wychmicini]
MAVSDGQWVAYWWPELLVWLCTIGLLVSLPVIMWRQRRRHRLSERRVRRGVTVYLDDDFVNQVKDADDVETEESAITTDEGGGSLTLKLLHVGKRASVTREIRRKFRETSSPIARIGGMLDVLDRENEIVRVDLVRKDVIGNAALVTSLNVGPDNLPGSVRLVGTGGFVLLTGTFQVINDPVATLADTVVLAAGYGGPAADATIGPRVTLACARKYMRYIPEGPIAGGRCLGWVEKWDAQTARLVFHPVALFR